MKRLILIGLACVLSPVAVRPALQVRRQGRQGPITPTKPPSSGDPKTMKVQSPQRPARFGKVGARALEGRREGEGQGKERPEKAEQMAKDGRGEEGTLRIVTERYNQFAEGGRIMRTLPMASAPSWKTPRWQSSATRRRRSWTSPASRRPAGMTGAPGAGNQNGGRGGAQRSRAGAATRHALACAIGSCVPSPLRSSWARRRCARLSARPLDVRIPVSLARASPSSRGASRSRPALP
jgi:hypothetical protein